MMSHRRIPASRLLVALVGALVCGALVCGALSVGATPAAQPQESAEPAEPAGAGEEPEGAVPGPLDPQETNEQQEQQEPRRPVQTDDLGLPSSAAMTDEEEEALRLVEEILREQEVILAGQNFVYRSEGRRDPFRNILQLRRRELVAPTQRPAGLAGFLIGEVQVKATARFQGRWQAMLVGLDGRTYFADVGTDLYDGRIVEINGNEVVFEQEVEDMLGARSSRRVVKKLNPESEG